MTFQKKTKKKQKKHMSNNLFQLSTFPTLLPSMYYNLNLGPDFKIGIKLREN